MKSLQFLVGKEVDIFNPNDTEEVDGLMASGKIVGIQEGWVILANPKSGDPSVVADAYFQQGDAYERLNQKDQAVANYKLLQKDFSGTNGEMLAEQALKRLGVTK